MIKIDSSLSIEKGTNAIHLHNTQGIYPEVETKLKRIKSQK